MSWAFDQRPVRLVPGGIPAIVETLGKYTRSENEESCDKVRYSIKGNDMKRISFIVMVFILCIGFAFGQKGSAESGYYPIGYSGDTWTGTVTATNDATREITLTYAGKDKAQTFVGVLRQGYKLNMKDGSQHELKVSELEPGMRIKVYYVTKKEKSESGMKIEVHEIFQVKFNP